MFYQTTLSKLINTFEKLYQNIGWHTFSQEKVYFYCKNKQVPMQQYCLRLV